MTKRFSDRGRSKNRQSSRPHRGRPPHKARPPQTSDKPDLRHVGVIVMNRRNLPEIKPADKKANFNYDIPTYELNGARAGDVVAFEVAETSRGDRVYVTKILGRHDSPEILSAIGIHEVGLHPDFEAATLIETRPMVVPELGQRTDLRSIPLVTIDGADARDFDDAVFAEETDDGFHLLVAIADVAYYVRPGSALDRDAYKRGNSTYLPDRVLPMLPEKLSNDLCSLRPHEDRACMAVHMWINRKGELVRHKFVRGLMRSQARLTYEQVQAAYDGAPDDTTAPLMDTVIKPLYKAFDCLWQARSERGVMDLEMPERRVLIDENNRMTGVRLRDRLTSHMLIEEFMILANVASGTELTKRGAPCIYRVHDKPDPVKIESVLEFVSALGLKLPIGDIHSAGQLNEILKQSRTVLHGNLLDSVLLRAQKKAIYSVENIEHFGLALMIYAHFTSPIRRYADLLVHRLLIRTLGLGEGGLDERELVLLDEMADHISQTERLSTDAERRTIDRFTAAYHVPDIDKVFHARIRGVANAGLFVELPDTGADVFVPRRTLPDDYYEHHETQHALIGERHGRVYRLGAFVDVRLKEADPISGNMLAALEGDADADHPGLNFQKTTGRTPTGRPLPPHKRRAKGPPSAPSDHPAGRPGKKYGRKKNGPHNTARPDVRSDARPDMRKDRRKDTRFDTRGTPRAESQQAASQDRKGFAADTAKPPRNRGGFARRTAQGENAHREMGQRETGQRENAQGRPPGQPHEKSHEKPRGKSHGKSHRKPQGKPSTGRPSTPSQGKPSGKPHAKPHAKPHDTDTAPGHTQGNPHGKTKGKPPSRSGNKPRKGGPPPRSR